MRCMVYNLDWRVPRALTMISVVQRSRLYGMSWESLLEPFQMAKRFFPISEILLYRILNKNDAI